MVGSVDFLTLLYEYGFSFISPVFSTVAPLVICLIYGTWAYLITYEHTVISSDILLNSSIFKRLNINDVIEMMRTKFISFQVPKISRHKLSGTWHPSGAAF